MSLKSKKSPNNSKLETKYKQRAFRALILSALFFLATFPGIAEVYIHNQIGLIIGTILDFAKIFLLLYGMLNLFQWRKIKRNVTTQNDTKS